MQIKALAIALFYFFSSVGYGLEVHYCLGSVSDVSYFLFDAECPCDETHDANSQIRTKCCEDRVFFNQLDEEHSSPAMMALSKVWLPVIDIQSAFTPEHLISSGQSSQAIERGPPLIIDRSITYHKLILYG